MVQLSLFIFSHRSILLTLVPFEFNFGAVNIEDTELILFLVVNDIDGLQLVLVMLKIIFRIRVFGVLFDIKD